MKGRYLLRELLLKLFLAERTKVPALATRTA
jgi:hypothetical protein